MNLIPGVTLEPGSNYTTTTTPEPEQKESEFEDMSRVIQVSIIITIIIVMIIIIIIIIMNLTITPEPEPVRTRTPGPEACVFFREGHSRDGLILSRRPPADPYSHCPVRASMYFLGDYSWIRAPL